MRAALIISKESPNTVEPGTAIGYWSREIIEEARRRGGFPIVKIMWPEDLELLATKAGAKVATKVANDNLVKSRNAADLIPLSDDALVDQNNPRVPKKWFMRAAKAGRFPCSKEGREYIARWGDVRAALALENMTPKVRKAGPRDNLREVLGLKKKG